MKRELRDDQKEALEELRQAMRAGNHHVIMQAPTGYGKTLLAAGLTANARAKNKKVLFTVPAISLIDQTVEMFYHQGIVDVGVIQASHELTNWSKPVQIASVQTLHKREMPDADVILIDEVHKWFQFYEKLLLDPARAKQPIIGLSATPWTKGLGAYFKGPIIASTTEHLIEGGLLSPFKVFAPTHPDLEGVHTRLGDYVEAELADRMDTPLLVADVVETWLKRAENRPTLCFAVNRVHAKHLQEKFIAAGVPAAYQDAYTSAFDRTVIKQRFHDGTVKVVCNVGTLTTGVDWDVRCISMARPTKSEMLFVQIVGRGLRTASGKDHCLILDHSDNHLRLGFVTDVDARHFELHDGKTPTPKDGDEKIRLPKECPQCAFLKPPRCAKCPNCGFVAQVQNDIVEDDGELVELKKPKRGTFGSDFGNEQKARFYGELKAYALRHEYKPGWADVKYREVFKVWPNYYKATPPAVHISAATEGWIKSTQIAWARSKRKAEWEAQTGAAIERARTNGTISDEDHEKMRPGPDATRDPQELVPGTLMTREDLEVDL